MQSMMHHWVIERANLAEVVRLAHWLAVVVRKGDLIALRGDLGTGKTTFARALIAALVGLDEAEVLSPTFAIAQAYDGERLTIHHFDFYRLNHPTEVLELGFEDALDSGIAIVEWPEVAEDMLPGERLEIAMSDGSGPGERRLSLHGHGGWSKRLARLQAIAVFVASYGWQTGQPLFLQGDASPRAYTRLAKDAATSILMDAPRQPDGPPIRDGLPYSKLAHLAEDVRPYVAVAGALRASGLSVPEIYGYDLEAGFLLIEDFGHDVYGRLIDCGHNITELYQPAVDALIHLAAAPPPKVLALPDGSEHELAQYDEGAFLIEVELLVDWYLPAVSGMAVAPDVRQEFVDLWRQQITHVVDGQGWVLRDFHSPNLMWLAERQGMQRVGILDFQDALRGHPAFDLASLCQDARLDVPEALEAGLVERYCAGTRGLGDQFEERHLRHAYAVLGAQRNTKILGIFARLAIRDCKKAYLQHVPRIKRYLARNLAHPALATLRLWYDRHLPDDSLTHANIGAEGQ